MTASNVSICRCAALLCHISSAQILLRAKHTQNKSPLRAAEAPCFGWCTSGAVFFCLLCSGWFAPVRFSFCFSVASRSSYDATCTSTQLLATETKSIELSSAAAADLVSTSSWSSCKLLFINYVEAFSLGNKPRAAPPPKSPPAPAVLRWWLRHPALDWRGGGSTAPRRAAALPPGTRGTPEAAKRTPGLSSPRISPGLNFPRV